MLTTSVPKSKTVYFMKGYTPKACVFEESEIDGEDLSFIDDENCPDYDEEYPETFSEEEEIASFMAKNGLKTMEEYDQFMDDALDEFEERRRVKIAEANEY